VNHEGLAISRQPQSSNHGRGDSAAAEEYD
jgi:hypothetical protein